MFSFKEWLNQTKGLDIALVGWTGSSIDQELFKWIEDYFSGEGRINNYDDDIAGNWHRAHKDVININQGRDFLAENQKYDLVILCWIFGPSHYQSMSGEYNVSENHTPEQWRARLRATGAAYIVVSGGRTEVSGDYIGNIPGYYAKKISPSLTIYTSWSTWENN